MIKTNFYETLPTFNQFQQFTQDNHFSPLPEDWSIIISDIKGSTQAIAEGRYKDVNTIGAATIVVARKAMQGKDFPFVFGGDGATLLVPSDKQDTVVSALCSLRNLSRQNHQLDLRIGVLKMSELMAMGKTIEVAKFELTQGRSVAIMRGSGLNWAEKLIKENPEKYNVDIKTGGNADLEGLTCRWKPIPNKNGLILSLLVASRKGNEVYQGILDLLDSTLPHGIEGSNPVNIQSARYEGFWKSLKHALKLTPSVFSKAFVLRFLELCVATLIFKLGVSGVFF